MFTWVDNRAVDVSNYATPIMKTGHAKFKKTQLGHLEDFYASLGAFAMYVRGSRCCVYRSREVCILLNTTMDGMFATPESMFKTIMDEHTELSSLLAQVLLCKRRLVTILNVLRLQSTLGRQLLQQIRPNASNLIAFSFLEHTSDSYQTALNRFEVYNEIIDHHISDVLSIVEYMERSTKDASNAALMFDAIVNMIEVCMFQRTNIIHRIATCRLQVSPEVIASQLQICNDHMCTSLELCAAVYHKGLIRCSLCMQPVSDEEGHCTKCVFGLRNMCRSIKNGLV